MSRHGIHRQNGPRLHRASQRARSRGHHHRHPRQGHGRSDGWFHDRQARDHRHAAPAQPSLPLFEFTRPKHCGGLHRGVQNARRDHRIARHVGSQHRVLQRGTAQGRFAVQGWRIGHCSSDVGRRQTLSGHGQCPSRRGHLCDWVLLSGGAQRRGAHPRAAQCGPHP